MDRKTYKLPFKKTHTPRWICPSCKEGVLIIKKDTFNTEESSASKKSSESEDWLPEWIEYVYSCILRCNNSRCKESVSNTGIGSVDYDIVYDEEGCPDQEYCNFYKPKYFSPHLKIFSYNKDTPKEVSEEIENSFKLFFCDPSAASLHFRIAIENLLTYLKVKKYEKSGGKLNFVSLHRRIGLLANKYDHIKDLFIAIKWLGNAGSHSHKKITEDDVMDAYEIMEEILNELFLKKKKHINKLAKQIIKKKGPKK